MSAHSTVRCLHKLRCMHADQVSLNGAAVALDDSNIAWKTDINKRFPSANASYFNTVPELRGGNSISGSIKVHSPAGTGSVRAIQGICFSDSIPQGERPDPDDVMPCWRQAGAMKWLCPLHCRVCSSQVVQHLRA